MKKYGFSLTKKEIFEFSIRAVLEQMRLNIVVWLFALAVLILDSFVILWIDIIYAVFILGIIFLSIYRNYSFMKENLYGKTRTMWVEAGMLKVDTDACVYGEIPCDSIQVIRKTANLLMLGHYQAKKRLAWYPMPLRVFANSREMDEFINIIHNPKAYSSDSRVVEDLPPENEDKEFFHLFFRINEDKWKQIVLETANIVRSGVLGGLQKSRAVLAILVMVLAAKMCYICFFDIDIYSLTFVFLLIFILILLIKILKGNSEGLIRKQLNQGLMQNDVYGDWEISILESGVVWSGPKQGRTKSRWEKFSWLIETDTAFYLFWEDRRHYVMILKESIGSYEQAEALKQLCMDKHITYAKDKKVKYVPSWVFYILEVVLIAGYFAAIIGLAFRDSRRSAEESTSESGQDYGTVAYIHSEEFNPSDYPDYTPLEEQVSVLQSQGITVSEKIVKSAQDTMEEYDTMRVFVEGYPYTWLLMETGTPDYNDEWEITGYSDEVFWFDFEGWDISTDYIMVLEGMLALAPGSAISGVTNISEDTTDVDWDKGSGSIEVSLEWNGQEYSWKMDMYYDWIDESVLGILNSLLEQTDEEERFYVTGDNGQGAIVFYCSKEWAEEFEKATGLEMSTY